MPKQPFTDCTATFEDADIVLFGAPFDATSTHRKGSRLAPQAIRNESINVETYSPYSDRDLLDISVHDAGDLVFKSDAPLSVVDAIEAKTAEILAADKFPVMLGGEHLVTLGAFRAIHKKYNDVCLIHFDAHTDLRADWLGEKLNHSTVIRCCHDVMNGATSQERGNDVNGAPTQEKETDVSGAPVQKKEKSVRIFQFGIRSGEREEFRWAEQNTSLCKHGFDTLDSAIKAVGSRPVYFTIDLDVLDPGEFGGTGTPEAGGVSFLELMKATKKVFEKLNVVGCDINELCPPCDTAGTSTALASKYTREILLLIR